MSDQQQPVVSCSTPHSCWQARRAPSRCWQSSASWNARRRATRDRTATGSRHSVVAAETEETGRPRTKAGCRFDAVARQRDEPACLSGGMQSPAGESVARSEPARRPVACCSSPTVLSTARMTRDFIARSCLPSESRQRLLERMSSARNRRNWSIQSGVVHGRSPSWERRRHRPIDSLAKRRRSQKDRRTRMSFFDMGFRSAPGPTRRSTISRGLPLQPRTAIVNHATKAQRGGARA